MDELKEYRNLLTKNLKFEINNKSKDFPFYFDTKFYLDYILAGKLIRGSLIIKLCDTYKIDRKLVLSFATSIELIHSSLLIHDDIIDQDSRRRGLDSMHVYYKKEALSRNFDNPEHFGTSIALTLADTGFFIANQILNSTGEFKSKDILLKLMYKEIVHVGIAQIKDIEFGFDISFPNTDDILKMYKFKTGRYTFSLPLIIYSYLTNLSQKDKRLIDTIGEDLGIIYQLTDDNLSLFGDPSLTGKSLGNDIKEKKKTYILSRLINNCTEDQKNKIKKILNKKNISEQDIKNVIDLFKVTQTKKEIDNYIKSKKIKVYEKIDKLGIKLENKKVLRNLLEFISDRNK